MNVHLKNTRLLLKYFLFSTVVACGVESRKEMATLSGGEKGASSSSEETIGLVNMTGAPVDSGSSLQRLVNVPDHWEYYSQNRPVLYVPENLVLAKTAFKRSYFKASNQDCSGVMIHEQNSSGFYDVYYMTAKHCLYAVNALGERTQVAATQAELTGFELRDDLESRVTVKRAFESSFNGLGIASVLTRKSYQPATSKQQLNFSEVQVYLGADVIRIPVARNLKEGEAFGSALPICNTVAPAGNKVFSSGQTDIRLMVGYEPSNQRLLMERMNGKHNLAGEATGEYRPTSTFSSVQKFVFDSLMFGSNPQYYGYKTSFKAGAEASDSGAPVYYGRQSPSSKTIQGTSFSFTNGSDKSASHWKLDSIDCVSGVISRVFTKNLLRLSDAHASPAYAYDSSKLWDVGAETITIIQEVVHNPSAWKKL